MPIAIDTSVQYLKGVGPKLGAQLGRRGIHTVGDLLHCYPRAYEDRRAIRNISSLREGQVVSLVAEILGVRSFFLGKSRKKIYEMLLKDESGKVVCKYFRIPHRGYFDRFQSYDKVRVVGKVTNYRGRLEFHHPEIHHIDGTEEEEDSLVP
ncbi:MAG: ATP-dependent DNA helicase RecG, partial [Bdellovibrionales bacterium]|nr:ATP-dependent DNA helicase RecG [Bdellovibrionales bacterium]